ncbi:MAG: hypothetical protein CM1200mP2_56300 [Planctomycetaceae bacterium]|nr:MAG: hypothetical protein CM1200mP2_56300 [Planctomycetaceae bacterium]
MTAEGQAVGIAVVLSGDGHPAWSENVRLTSLAVAWNFPAASAAENHRRRRSANASGKTGIVVTPTRQLPCEPTTTTRARVTLHFWLCPG